jgi:LacI family transcriptional regulator
MVTLADVARAAGVSAKTASRVINGDPQVAPATRARVEAAVEALGYQVNVLARSLRRGHDNVVGVIVESVRDPFFSEVIGDLEQLITPRGFTVMVASNTRGSGRERVIVEGFIQRSLVGMIVTPQDADYSFLRSIRMPVVFIDRRPRNLDADVVLADDRGATLEGVNHLARYGHRSIALISDALDVQTVRNRYEGYLDAMREAGLPVDPSMVRIGCLDADMAEKETVDLLHLPQPPTAILSTRGETSQGVVRALHRHDATDVAVVSVGDFALADSVTPAITVLDHSPTLIGRYAAERLFARLDGESGHPITTTIPVPLIARGSGELPPRAAVSG